jgi:hypothetical protein
MGPFKDIGVDLADMVATIEIRRPPHNFFDIELIRQIADACEALDKDSACRAIVLAAQGTAFCAGAKLGDGADVQNVLVKKSETGQAGHLYIEAVRLFRTAKPMVGAIHGAAVGGGLGLALVPDLRVTCPEARFSANFTRLGFHPGFGLTHTLPALIGPSRAALMFYTSRRVTGEEAYRMGPRRRAGAPGGGALCRPGSWRPRSPWPRRSACWRRGRPCVPASPTVCARPPPSSSRSRPACARPPTSRKASTPPTSAGCRNFRGGSFLSSDPPAMLSPARSDSERMR